MFNIKADAFLFIENFQYYIYVCLWNLDLSVF